MKLKSKQLTALKKKPIDSTELEGQPGMLHRVEKQQIIDVEHYEDAVHQHIKVHLKWGQGIWYAFKPHWEFLENYSPNVQSQIEALSRYVQNGHQLNLETNVIYASQRDNKRDQHRTCNASSNAMYLDWLMRATGKQGLGVLPSGLLDDNGYVRTVFTFGDTTIHWVQSEAIKAYGFTTKWMTDRNYPFVIQLLEAGIPVVVNILHRGSTNAPRGGHVICLIGKQEQFLVSHDPYGTLRSDYTNHKGAYSTIPEWEFKIRWQGGYRIAVVEAKLEQQARSMECLTQTDVSVGRIGERATQIDEDKAGRDAERAALKFSRIQEHDKIGKFIDSNDKRTKHILDFLREHQDDTVN